MLKQREFSILLVLLVVGCCAVDALIITKVGKALLPTHLVKTVTNTVSHILDDTTSHSSQNESTGPEKIEDIVTNIGNISHKAMNLLGIGTSHPNNSTKVNDCLGLGKTVAGELEKLLKNEANGTKAQDAHFYLSSRKKPKRVEVVIGKQFGLEWTDFEIERDTVIIVHGFLSNGNETWITNMANAFLYAADVNVIAVDWSDGSNTYNYYKAVFNTQTTGNQIATLIGQIANYTMEKNDPDIEHWGHIHCIGHSLGAHICGYAGNEIKRRNNDWKISRITGLDPAQPCFQTVDLSLKLDMNDAPFVDIIHTNGRLMSDVGLGLPQPIGHVDFYPNGGKQQPGCVHSDFKIANLPTKEIHQAVCNHGRSYLYFTESIANSVSNNCTFWAHPWDRTYRHIQQILKLTCQEQICTEMGYNSIKYKYRGTFFALTADSEPYCRPRDSYWDQKEVENILKDDYKETLKD